jgi:hypothetical protein
MTTTRNGLCHLGDGVRMSAHNYSLAEAMSDVSGRGDPLAVPPSTGSISAGSAPSAVGVGSSAPAGWGWVAPYIGMIWPNGDSAKLRAAAVAWFSAGTNFEVSEIVGGAGPMGAVGSQQIPEGPAIAAAFGDATRSAAGILQQCMSIGAQLNAYAAKIDEVHAAILDLLARICDPMTGIKEVWDILTDKDEDEIKKIADDIRTVVNQFTSEVDALRHQIAAAVSEATTIVSTMAKQAEKEFSRFVGDAVRFSVDAHKAQGQNLLDVLTQGWDFSVTRALIDPEGSAHDRRELINELAPLVGAGGEGAPGVVQSWKEEGKQVLNWDDWAQGRYAQALAGNEMTFAPLMATGPGSRLLTKLDDLGRTPELPHPGTGSAPPPPHMPVEKPPGGVSPTEAPAAGRPQPTSPGVPHIESPQTPGPTSTSDRTPTPAPTKPASAPTDTPSPHGPTESKAPVAEKPAAGDSPRSPASAGQHPANIPTLPGDRAPGTHPQPSEPAVTRPAPTPDGHLAEPAPTAAHAPQSAPAGSVPHAPIPDSSPPSAHPPAPPPPPDGGAPGGHSGGHHGPAEGSGPHGSHPPGDSSVDPHGLHPPGDGSPPDHPPSDHPAPGHVTPSDLPPYRQHQLELAQSPEQLARDLLRRGCPPEIAESVLHSPYEGMTPQEVLDRYWDSENGTWHWPPDNGFAEGKYEVANKIPKDVLMDRIGEVSAQRGDYMGSVGDSYPQRGLAPGTSGDYGVFQGTGKPLPDNWELRYGKVGEAFDQPGGGTQWVVVDKITGHTVLIRTLIDGGHLRRIN